MKRNITGINEKKNSTHSMIIHTGINEKKNSTHSMIIHLPKNVKGKDLDTFLKKHGYLDYHLTFNVSLVQLPTGNQHQMNLAIIGTDDSDLVEFMTNRKEWNVIYSD